MDFSKLKNKFNELKDKAIKLKNNTVETAAKKV
jgi:hypothetical protein